MARNPYLNRSMIRGVDQFFGRQREVERIMSRLGADPPQSISIVGARRVGKSSLIWHIAQEEIYARYLDTPGRYVFLVFDFQGQQHLDQSGFCRVLGEHLNAACGDRISIPDLDSFGAMETAVRNLSAQDLRLVCLFDEFETVTRNPGFGEEFFGFLRALANSHPVAFVTTSRRALQSLCHTSEISESPFFNIFAQIGIGPLDEASSRQLIARPSSEAGTPLSDYEEALVDLSGHLPLFLQMVCAAAFECSNERRDGVLDEGFLEQRFMEEASSHFHYIWDHFADDEREAVVRLAAGNSLRDTRSIARSLREDGFVREIDGRPRLFSTAFTEFVLEQTRPATAVDEATAGGDSKGRPLVAESPVAPPQSGLEPLPDGEDPFPQIVGCSAAIRLVFAMMKKAAEADDTVLLTGETGTGKELVAQCIHESSQRRNGPFVPVNCGAIAEHLQESELFGHKKGAFTDAGSDREGLFEAANGGTLFLDEIGEVGSATQVKLLRVLQEGEVRRVGENQVRKVDIRLICATNRNLEAAVSDGGFRDDLYYRLYVLALELPALRDRMADIPLLVDCFLERYAAGIGDDALARLKAYAWPGNIRELENQLTSARAMAGGKAIGSQHLWPRVVGAEPSYCHDGAGTAIDRNLSFKEAREQFERSYIQARLVEFDWEMSATAEALGISRSRLYELATVSAEAIGSRIIDGLPFSVNSLKILN